MMNKAITPLVECAELVKTYASSTLASGKACFAAVDRVNLAVAPGETLALVGESGCGKSTTGRLLLGLEAPSSGSVVFDGTELQSLGERGLRAIRKRMQMVFQDPYGSLNPRFTVRGTLAEPLRIHLKLSGPRLEKRICELLESVGLEREHAGRYPHEFSGGQRQRIAIARAIAVEPDFVVADEPVSALDISIQGQILRLLVELRHRLGMAMLFISHDLTVVRQVSDRVAVMYRGRLVELAPAQRIFEHPAHPYTRLLLDSVLRPEPSQGGKESISEQTNNLLRSSLQSGCAFSARCQLAGSACLEAIPRLREIAPGHYCACLQAAAPAANLI
jgi:peptide/nickel transport system ATP-binding protein